ncbi:ABC transporter substrate-binding protein [Subtercola frigoramans]|uniref:Multiple sugar transport system substrate-binding protein n=1 Tax=Subtercola frigoramans TaxID=120298 RepID=A0ABS2L216_9MICO|nr:sugar ABC transporter substrate-binding protein [Subtercola frigoramans]MBM7471116.1 multiple sugar transport system substrate-binding protein [Subtercola frigoramans]
MTITRHRVKRAVFLGAVPAVVATLLLSGCGRTDSVGAATATPVDDSPATGTIEFWAGAPDGDSLPAFLAPFEAANPDVKVNVTVAPSNGFDTKLTTAISSGTVPDMVFLYSQTQSSMLATDAFAPVPTGLVDPASFFKTSYDGTLVDGTAYAVPWYSYANVWYYRKDLVEAAGVPLPKTWADMETFAASMQKTGVANPIGLSVAWDGYSAQSLSEFAKANGGSFISDDNKEWTINSKENVEALDYWAGLIKKGYASADGPQFLDTTPWFSSGQTVLLNNGPWFPGWLDDANGAGWSATHVGSIVAPAGVDGSVGSIGGGSLAVLKDGKNQAAAWKLVQWMSQPDVQAKWYDTFGNLPAVQSAWDSSTAISTDPLLTAVKASIPTAVSVPQVPTWSEVGTVIGTQMERVARGEATAQEALDEAQSQAASIGTGVK